MELGVGCHYQLTSQYMRKRNESEEINNNFTVPHSQETSSEFTVDG